jgi:hypothetical protein
MTRRRLWAAILAELPVAGSDPRTDLIAGLYIGIAAQ